MSFIAMRGDEKITPDDLKAHIASLLRLENVGVFLGAGASVGVGGKTIKSIWKDFINNYAHEATTLSDNGYVTIDDTDTFDWNLDPTKQPPNIEVLLDSLEIARIDLQRRGKGKPNQELTQLENSINALLGCIVSAVILNSDFWKNPNSEKPALENHKKLLQKIVGARQPGQPSPWIFTTNYDLAIEWAAEDIGIHVHTGFVGIHNRSFSPQSFDLGFRNVRARGEARFGSYDVYLVKLHGSLTWVTDSASEFRELAASEIWPKLHKIIQKIETVDDSLMVFPRAAKYRQTVGFLSGELFRRFSDFLSTPQTCLMISGYSFGDEHLNRLIKSAILNPTLQIVVFLPEFKGYGDEVIKLLKEPIKKLINLKSPRITFVGSDQEAYFNNMVSTLPDPILFDLSEREMRERFKKDAENKDRGDSNA